MARSADIPLPLPEAICRSLFWLRSQSGDPLDPEYVAQCYDLLMTPFAQLVAAFEDRPRYVPAAIRRASARLGTAERIVIDHMLLTPSTQSIDARAQDPWMELQAQNLVRGEAAAKVVRRVEERAYLALSKILLSPEFAREFADAEGLEAQVEPGAASDEAIVYIRRCFGLDFASDGTATDYEAVEIQALTPGQQVLGHRYYNRVASSPDSVEVFSRRKGHSFLAAREDKNRGTPGWNMYFFDLGRSFSAGENDVVTWGAKFAGAEPFVAFIVRHDQMQSLSLAIRLPPPFRDIPGEAAVTADPYKRREVLHRWERQPSADGWVMQHFTDLEVGLQYGISFPDIDFSAVS